MLRLRKSLSRIIRFGILLLLSLLYKKEHPTILMYHSVGRNDSFFSTITDETFEWQLKYLMDNGYEIITMDDVADFYHNGKQIPDKSVCITFDDGFLDNLTNALPILEKYNANATIYIATDFVSDQKKNAGKQMCSVDDIKKLASSPHITIGGHTHTHPMLSKLTNEDIMTEISQGKELLEKWTDREIKHFAYPKGDFNEQAIECVKKHNFLTAVTTTPGHVDGSNCYMIKRIPVDKSLPKWLFKYCFRYAFTKYSELRKRVFKEI